MRIVIPTIGSRGDIQPFIALAQGLTRAGHAVTLASHPVMKELIETHDVIFAPSVQILTSPNKCPPSVTVLAMQ
jgi:sterol 3beta-glucosyltransferase